ncbi:MAG: helix-turn-helix domain-containing protein [Pseudomonadota bacterium]
MPKSLSLSRTEQTELFAQDLRRICGSFDVDHADPHLRGSAVCQHRSGLDLAVVDQNARSIRRRRHNIKSDPGNHFFLVLQSQGRAEMVQDDCVASLRKGDMFLVDSTRPSSFFYNGNRSRQISLHLPRSETIARFGKRANGGMHISARDPLAQAMRAILMELLDGKCPGHGQVAEAFHSVFGAYLFNRSIGEPGQLSQDRQIINRALAVIQQHFEDPDFAPRHLADLTGVSLRRLQRAFHCLNSSPYRRLQEARLNAASNLLRQTSDWSQKSITNVAFDCGFRDLSTFYRHFKTRYGCTPTEWRAVQ